MLNLFAVENGRLGENLTTVEMIFLKDCGSFCRGQDADDDGRRHQGLHHVENAHITLHLTVLACVERAVMVLHNSPIMCHHIDSSSCNHMK